MTRNWELMETPSYGSPYSTDQFYVGRVLWQRRRKLLLGLLLGLTAAGAYYLFAPPKFESTAQLLYVHKGPQSVPGLTTQVSHLDEYLAVHEALMESPVVIREAIEYGQLNTLPSLASEIDVKQVIIDGLNISSGTTSTRGVQPGIIDLAYRSTNAQDSQKILQAIMKSYDVYLQRSQEDDSSTVRSLFNQWSNEIRQELAAKEDHFKQLLGESPHVVWDGDRAISLAQERLGRIEAQKIEQLTRLHTAERQIKAIEDARAAGLEPHIVDQLAAVWGTPTNSDVTLQRQYLELLFEEQRLLTQYGPKHPEVMAVGKQIELLRKQIPQELQAPGDESSASTVYTYALTQERDVAKELVDTFSELIESEQTGAKQNSDRMVEIEQLRSDIASMQELYKEISRQIQGMDLVGGAEAFEARVISPPEIGKQVSPEPIMVTAAGTLVGLLIGGVLCFLSEMRDQSIRSPGDVRRRLASGVIGVIPPLRQLKRSRLLLEANGHSPSPMVWTFHQPDASESEAFRALRTSLLLAQRCEGHRVIQITSPSSADGKSTLAANLGTSLAQTKQRVLLVEADFRSPKMHELLPVDHHVGLANLLSGDAELNEAIQATSVPGLFVLPSGSLPRHSTELLTGTQLHEVLQEIRERFDFVLVDTPGLLAVSDAWMIVPYVDGVLLVVGASSQWPHVARAKEILDSLHARTLGVVLNGFAFSDDMNGFGIATPELAAHVAMLEQLPSPTSPPQASLPVRLPR